MKRQKSLRQLARELGVSHSYLSQVNHGKRPASDRVASFLGQSGKQSGKQNTGQDGTIISAFVPGGVPELADGHDLGSCALGRGGSSPPFPTKGYGRQNSCQFTGSSIWGQG